MRNGSHELAARAGIGAKTRDEAARSELGVVVRCHHVACIIPTRWVVRLVLPDEVTHVAPGVVNVGRELYAVWDLGDRLGLPPVEAAWVLMRVPRADVASVPIALRTGPCLVVQPLPRRVELPIELFVSRGDAIAGVFAANASHGGAVYGLELDVPHLWTPSELAASAALLRSGEG